MLRLTTIQAPFQIPGDLLSADQLSTDVRRRDVERPKLLVVAICQCIEMFPESIPLNRITQIFAAYISQTKS